MENSISVEDFGTSGQDQSKSDDVFMTIGQMSHRYNLSMRALRFYEDRGLLKPHRQGILRLYDCRQQQRVEMILKGKRLGFTLAQILEMIGNQARDAAPELEASLQPKKIVNQIDQLQRRRDAIDLAIRELKATHDRLAGPGSQVREQRVA